MISESLILWPYSLLYETDNTKIEKNEVLIFSNVLVKEGNMYWNIYSKQ